LELLYVWEAFLITRFVVNNLFQEVREDLVSLKIGLLLPEHFLSLLKLLLEVPNLLLFLLDLKFFILELLILLMSLDGAIFQLSSLQGNFCNHCLLLLLVLLAILIEDTSSRYNVLLLTDEVGIGITLFPFFEEESDSLKWSLTYHKHKLDINKPLLSTEVYERNGVTYSRQHRLSPCSGLHR
jgi:hypothetical protein